MEKNVTFPISGQSTGRNSASTEKEVHGERWNLDVLPLSVFSEPWKGLAFPSKIGPKILNAKSRISIQIPLSTNQLQQPPLN